MIGFKRAAFSTRSPENDAKEPLNLILKQIPKLTRVLLFHISGDLHADRHLHGDGVRVRRRAVRLHRQAREAQGGRCTEVLPADHLRGGVLPQVMKRNRF